MLCFSTALLSCGWILKHFANSTFGALCWRWDVTAPRLCAGGSGCQGCRVLRECREGLRRPGCNNLTRSLGWDLLHPASPGFVENSMVSFMTMSNQELGFTSCFKVYTRPHNYMLIWFSRDWIGARSWSHAGTNQRGSSLRELCLFLLHLLLTATVVLVVTCQVFC